MITLGEVGAGAPPANQPGTRIDHRGGVPGAALVVAVMLLGFGVRLLLGMRTPLDADEATFGLAALHITQGQAVLMEPNGQYLGALDAYVAAPFVALLGTTLIAVRLALGVVGAAYVLTMYWLGRVLFGGHARGLVTAAIAAVFPLFAVYWGAKLRGGYTELPALEAACLALTGMIGWGRGHHVRWWALLGLVAGVALWSDLLFISVLAVIVVGLLFRGSAIGWTAARRGAAVAVVTGVIGMLPWLAFNIPNGLDSLHAIPKNYIGIGTGVANLVRDHLPILIGGSSGCGENVVAPLVSDAAIGVLAVALIGIRRRQVRSVLTGRFSGFEALDLTLLVLPVTVVMLVLSRINSDPCQPRYVMPMAVPLVAGLAAVLLTRMPGRAIAAGAAAVWLAISGIAATGNLPDMRTSTPSGAMIPLDLSAGLRMIDAANAGPLWAQYWLSRPLSYASHDSLPIGEYGGYVAFLRRQQEVETAQRPSWVFVAGDTDIAAFMRVCRSASITYRMHAGGGLVLFSQLSAAVEPDAVLSGAAGRSD